MDNLEKEEKRKKTDERKKPEEKKPLVEVHGISKEYSGKYVLRDISFTADRGEIIGLLGPNGAGKSTTMNIMTGYLSSSDGYVKYEGFDVLDDATEAKKHFGYLPETPPLYPDMTVKEYLSFVYDLKKVTFNRKKHLEEVARVTRTEDVLDKQIAILSRGYRQRVGMAGAIIGNPPVIILDEPTAGLDPAQIMETRALIRTLGREHTVIISSHLLSEIQAVADRIIVLSDGKLVANERATDIAKRKSANNRIKITVDAPKKEANSFLLSRDGIVGVTVLSDKDAGVTFMVETEKDIDIRKSLFFALAEKGWPILSLEPQSAGLEEIFLSITGYDGTGKKTNKGGRK